MTARARGEERLRLAARGKVLAWRQVDALAPATELQRAELLLRRLYPGLHERSLRQVLAQLAEAEEAGDRHGFQRPDPLSAR
jgi:hypothetical protein